MSTALILLPVVVAVIIGALRFLSAYVDGYLDGQYPNTADGDYRNGIARAVYAHGLRRGEIQIEIVRNRRAVTNERKEAKS